MSSAPRSSPSKHSSPDELRADARRHLAPHFTRSEAWRSPQLPVMERGEGCHLYDVEGHRWLDGLSGLFCVNLGHGRADLAEAAATQLRTLSFTHNWGAAHPPAIEAARLIAERAPGDLETVFFVNSGSEAVESAVKFARQYHRSQGAPERTKVISRHMAYHGTTLGALSVTGVPHLREPFGPLLDGFLHVPNTLGLTGDCGPADALEPVQAIERVIAEEGPETIAALVAEPVQNANGALVPPHGYWQELRRICDRHGILLVADEVICGFGRLGEWFGSVAFDVVPDLITFAKGATSGYQPLGGVILREPLAAALADSPGGAFTHGATWGGHPAATAVSAATLRAMADEDVIAGVRERAPVLRKGLDALHDSHRCVKEIRGTGFFYAVDLMADRHTGRELDADEARRVLREVLPAAFRRTGVLLRGDDRGGCMIMVSPPLVADETVLAELVAGIDGMLTDVETTIAP